MRGGVRTADVTGDRAPRFQVVASPGARGRQHGFEKSRRSPTMTFCIAEKFQYDTEGGTNDSQQRQRPIRKCTTVEVHVLEPKHRLFLIKAPFFCSVPHTTPPAPMIHYPSVVRPGLGGALPPGNHHTNGIRTGTATTSGSLPNHTLLFLEDQKTS